MSSVSVAARPLVDPMDGVAAAVEARRWVVPLLVVMACVTLSSVALYLRWDASHQVVTQLTATGEITHITEKDLDEKIGTTERIALVVGVAKGLFLMPLFALVVAVALKFAGWLTGVKAGFGKCFTAAALALLPIGLYHLIYAGCAFSQVAVSDSQIPALVPSSFKVLFPHASEKVGRVLGALEFFNLWSAGLLGLGFSAASGMRKGRAVALGFVLYVLYAAVVLVGLPGMKGGGR